MGSSTSTVSPGEGTATGRLVWVTGKKGSIVFIVFCLREPPPHPSDLIWYHSLFSIPKVSEGFLSFFFLLKHMSLLMIIWKIGKSHSEPKGVPEGQILILTWSHRSVWWSLGVFSLPCGLLSSLHGSRMFQQKYGSHALKLKVCFLVMLRSSLSYNKVIKTFFSFGWQENISNRGYWTRQ